ncbi:hypothetical protein QQ020_11800 [Fulvivirgaceae bacterium BMA12]|uniref:Peptidase S9 prolyl oligopeptidase catalytic domain-containing protein n=1 Tax=Agaribacillus aureus TaxID=3051825 RepID=A0ABT8L4U7_9BACT|nr:hypothetical protein [Fulvivirgaceae bacterium BMA12]
MSDEADKPKAFSTSRRAFIKMTGTAGCVPIFPGPFSVFSNYIKTAPIEDMKSTDFTDPRPSVIGQYGSWAATLPNNPPKLSFRNSHWDNPDAWRSEAQSKTLELMSVPEMGMAPEVTLKAQYTFDGLDIEELSWQLPYGRPTEATLLKPQGAKNPLPAILGLHDHSGNKYFGRRKITCTSSDPHPLMSKHQEDYYEDLAWANEMAKRGYVVLVHDAFAFASRRILYQDVSEIAWGDLKITDHTDENPEDPENIARYNTWAAYHESEMAKSLFCAGTTWPGVFFAEDKVALDILSARGDVDARRIGCAGLSGGGLRTVYLGGMDARIKCAICVGFMSTWQDFLLYKSYTHTWMTYTPLLPNYLDFPEILGLRVPLPTMVLNNNEDSLFTLSEMKQADKILREIYDKANAADRYKSGFHPGGHKFDEQMQKDAAAWFDKWL